MSNLISLSLPETVNDSVWDIVFLALTIAEYFPGISFVDNEPEPTS